MRFIHNTGKSALFFTGLLFIIYPQWAMSVNCLHEQRHTFSLTLTSPREKSNLSGPSPSLYVIKELCSRKLHKFCSRLFIEGQSKTVYFYRAVSKMRPVTVLSAFMLARRHFVLTPCDCIMTTISRPHKTFTLLLA